MQVIGDFAREAHLTKAFDGSSIEQPRIAELLALIRSAPTSFNFQPGRYVVASSPEARGRVARSMEGGYEPNLPKVERASHVIVFCCLTSIPQAYIDHLAARQRLDGSFRTAADEANWRWVAEFGRRLHVEDRHDVQSWMEKQVYLVMGTALMGAAQLGIGACPMEGFHAHRLDAEFGLAERGLTSTLLLALGRRAPADHVIGRPKSRLVDHEVFMHVD